MWVECRGATGLEQYFGADKRRCYHPLTCRLREGSVYWLRGCPESQVTFAVQVQLILNNPIERGPEKSKTKPSTHCLESLARAPHWPRPGEKPEAKESV